MEYQNPTQKGIPMYSNDTLPPKLAGRLKGFSAALAKVNSQPVNVCVIGDSVSEGVASSELAGTNETDIWHHFVRRQFQRQWGGRGIGYVPAGWNRSPNTPWPATRIWTNLGVNPNSGTSDSAAGHDHLGIAMKRVHLLNSTAGNSRIFQVECDRFQLWCSPGSGNGKVTLDGNVLTTKLFDATGVTQYGGSVQTYSNMMYDSGEIPYGFHDIYVESNDALGEVKFEGGFFYNGDFDHGIHWWDMTNSGTSTANWCNGATGENTAQSQSWDSCLYRIKPDLVMMALGINDYGQPPTGGTYPGKGSTPAGYKANLLEMVSRIRAASPTCSILFIVPWCRVDTQFNMGDGSPPSDATWQKYRQSVYEVASVTSDCGVADWYNTMKRPLPDIYNFIANTNETEPNESNPSVQGQAGDNLHVTDIGMKMMALTVFDFFGSWGKDATVSGAVYKYGTQNDASHGAELAYVETLYSGDTATPTPPNLVPENTEINVTLDGSNRLIASFTENFRPVIIKFGMHVQHTAINGMVTVVVEDLSTGGFLLEVEFPPWKNANDTKYLEAERRVNIGDSAATATLPPSTSGTRQIALRLRNNQSDSQGNPYGHGACTILGNFGGSSTSTDAAVRGHSPTWIQVIDT